MRLCTSPVRPALEEESYAAASAVKILQVNQWVRRARQRVVEIHPEVSFVCLASVARRRQLLARAGIVLGPAGEKAGVDDILDAAAVAAWTALRVADDQARPSPGPA
jgi:predicted RNase H-like nuclease